MLISTNYDFVVFFWMRLGESIGVLGLLQSYGTDGGYFVSTYTCLVSSFKHLLHVLAYILDRRYIFEERVIVLQPRI